MARLGTEGALEPHLSTLSPRAAPQTAVLNFRLAVFRSRLSASLTNEEAGSPGLHEEVSVITRWAATERCKGSNRRCYNNIIRVPHEDVANCVGGLTDSMSPSARHPALVLGSSLRMASRRRSAFDNRGCNSARCWPLLGLGWLLLLHAIACSLPRPRHRVHRLLLFGRPPAVRHPFIFTSSLLLFWCESEKNRAGAEPPFPRIAPSFLPGFPWKPGVVG